MSGRSIVVLALVCLGACRASLSRPSTYTAGAGLRYCSDLSTAAEKEASTWSVSGWSLGVIGAGAVIAGPAMGPDESDGAGWIKRNRNVLVSTGGALLIATARVLLGSSDAAAKASGDATRELAAKDGADRDAFDHCTAIHAAWVDARKDANAGVITMLDDVKKAKEAAEKAKQEAAVSAAAAAKAADDGAKLKADLQLRVDALELVAPKKK